MADEEDQWLYEDINNNADKKDTKDDDRKEAEKEKETAKMEVSDVDENKEVNNEVVIPEEQSANNRVSDDEGPPGEKNVDTVPEKDEKEGFGEDEENKEGKPTEVNEEDSDTEKKDENKEESNEEGESKGESTQQPKEGNEEEDDESEDDDDVQVTLDAVDASTTPATNRFYRNATATNTNNQNKTTKGFDFNATGNINGQPVLEVNMDALEERPWQQPGADISDYFNYGMNEHTWKLYAEKQRRLNSNSEAAMSLGNGLLPPPLNANGKPALLETFNKFTPTVVPPTQTAAPVNLGRLDTVRSISTVNSYQPPKEVCSTITTQQLNPPPTQIKAPQNAPPAGMPQALLNALSSLPPPNGIPFDITKPPPSIPLTLPPPRFGPASLPLRPPPPEMLQQMQQRLAGSLPHPPPFPPFMNQLNTNEPPPNLFNADLNAINKEGSNSNVNGERGRERDQRRPSEDRFRGEGRGPEDVDRYNSGDRYDRGRSRDYRSRDHRSGLDHREHRGRSRDYEHRRDSNSRRGERSRRDESPSRGRSGGDRYRSSRRRKRSSSRGRRDDSDGERRSSERKHKKSSKRRRRSRDSSPSQQKEIKQEEIKNDT